MATADAVIRITADFDLSSVQSELKDLCKSLENLSNIIKDTFDDSAVKNFAQSCNDLSSGLESSDVFDYIGGISDLLSIFSELSKNEKIVSLVQDAMSAATTVWESVCTVAAGVTTAFGEAMDFLLGPIGLIIIAIVALIAIVILLIENWNLIEAEAIAIWTAISDFFTELWATITAAVTVAWQAITDFMVGLWTGISETAIAIWTAISDFFTGLWATITAAVTVAWQAIVDFMVGLWTGVSNTAIGIWTAISGFFAGLWATITEAATAAWQAIVDFIVGIWTGISDSAIEVWTGISDFFIGITDSIKLGFTTAWDGIQEVWTTVATWFTDNVITPLSTAFDKLKEALAGVWDDIWTKIKGTLQTIINGVYSMINFAINAINWLIEKLDSLSFTLPDVLGGGTVGFKISPLGNVGVPQLAQGAVIPPNREFIAMLGDQTSGTNIETPLTTMIEAFKTAISDMCATGSGENITVTMPVYLDSEKIYEGQQRVQQRRGTSAVKVGV